MGPLLEERVVNSDEKKTKNFKESKLDEGLSLKKYRNRFFIGVGIYYGVCFAANFIYNHPEIYKPLVDSINFQKIIFSEIYQQLQFPTFTPR